MNPHAPPPATPVSLRRAERTLLAVLLAVAVAGAVTTSKAVAEGRAESPRATGAATDPAVEAARRRLARARRLLATLPGTPRAREGRLLEAEALFTDLAREQGATATGKEARLGRATCLEQFEEHDLALAEVRALLAAPGSGREDESRVADRALRARAILARCCEASGLLEEALAAFRAVAEDPAFAAAGRPDGEESPAPGGGAGGAPGGGVPGSPAPGQPAAGTARRELPPLPAPKRFEALLGAARCLRDLGRLEEAREFGRQAQEEARLESEEFRAGELIATLRPVRERLEDIAAAVERQRAARPAAGRGVPYERRRALERALGRAGRVRAPEATRFLARLFAEPDPGLRALVVRPWLRVGGRGAAESLLAALPKARPAVRRAILERLPGPLVRGLPLGPAVSLATGGSDPATRAAAVALLGRTGTKEAAVALAPRSGRGFGADESALGRRLGDDITRALRRVRGVEAWRYLLREILGSRRAPISSRLHVARALTTARPEGGGAVLLGLLAERQGALAAAAAVALGRRRTPGAVEALAEQLARRRGDVDFLLAALGALADLAGLEERAEVAGAADGAVGEEGAAGDAEGEEGGEKPAAGAAAPAPRPAALASPLVPAEGILLRLAGHRDLRVRGLVVRLLGQLDSAAAVARALELLADPAWQVRRAALGAAANHPSRELVDALVARAFAEDGALLPDIFRLLIALTGVDRGPHPDRWQEYWEFAREEWQPPAELAGGGGAGGDAHTFVKRAHPEDADSPSYFGVEIVSKRVAFVVDVSGSMQAEVTVPTDDGGTAQSSRIDLAREELLGALGKLRRGTWFQIIRFNGAPILQTRKPVKLTKKSLARATRAIRGWGAAGGTNIYDSLELVLEAGLVDTVFLLSDGAPSAGRFVDPDRLAEEVKRLNASLQVTIHTVAIGLDSALLRRLAAENHGTYVTVGRPGGP